MRNGFWWPDGYAGNTGLAVKCVSDWKELSGADSNGVHSYNFWVIDFNFEPFGEMPSGKDGEWQPRIPGMVQLVRQNANYQVRGAKRIYSHCAYMCFYKGELAGLNKLTGDKGVAVFSDPAFMVGNLLSQGATLSKSMGEYSYWKIMAILCEIIGLLLAAKSTESGVSIIEGLEPLSELTLPQKLHKYLSLNLQRPISLREMAKAMDVSVSSLTHSYSVNTGEPPHEAHLRMRMERAGEMLRMQDSIKGVSEKLGFANVHHFTRAFKKKMGMPPAKFRDRCRRSIQH